MIELRGFRSLLSGILPVLATCCLSAHANAEWLQVTGSAVVEGGQYEIARVQARAEALEKAKLQFGEHIQSQQSVHSGALVSDKVNLQQQAQVKRAAMHDEYTSGDRLYVVMNVELEQSASCPGSQAAQYKKSIAVMGFSLQAPPQGNLGKLGGIDQGLAASLRDALEKQQSLIVLSATQDVLYSDVINAPTQYAQEGQLTQATSVAQNIGAQFVVSGVIRDLSLQDPKAFKNSAFQKLLNLGQFDNRKRNFALDLFVHDGFSGSIIWQERFQTAADWNYDADENIGFGSARFWQGSYGQEVQRQLNTMAYVVSEQLKCQPFMTRISRVQGKTLHFDAGASTGIRPGDTFALYRTYSWYDANRKRGSQLENAKTSLRVSQVHPEFGSGTIAIDPGRINIQEDDLLIAW